MSWSLPQRLAPLAKRAPGELLIHEIYQSIQGESTYAGLPCVFVRLAVCDARCAWCDTPYAFTQGICKSIDSIVSEVEDFHCPLVEITGGEPLLQAETHQLMSRLADAGLSVLLETSGAHDVAPVDRRVHIIMDLKCPDSGECPRNRWENLFALKPSDQIKFVIASRRDFLWAQEKIGEHELARRFTVLLSPAFGLVRPLDLAKWLLETHLPVRMQLQLHKYIWDPKARGV
jgi:7-carboxy-7-deazaguanine synthase